MSFDFFKNKRPNNDTLLADLRSGDAQRVDKALSTLWHQGRVQGKVKSFMESYRVHTTTWEDILQESLIDLLKNVQSGAFREAAQLETYLLGICENRVRNELRKSTRQVGEQRLPRTELHGETNELLAKSNGEHAATSLDPGVQHTLIDQRDEMLTQLMSSNLTEKCRERLVLYYWQGKGHREIAEQVGLSNMRQAINAVYDCREQLRRIIQKDSSLQSILQKLKDFQ